MKQKEEGIAITKAIKLYRFVIFSEYSILVRSLKALIEYIVITMNSIIIFAGVTPCLFISTGKKSSIYSTKKIAANVNTSVIIKLFHLLGLNLEILKTHKNMTIASVNLASNPNLNDISNCPEEDRLLIRKK